MRLGLSSEAAPDASLGELLDAVVRRGLTTLELRDGDAHGVAPEDRALSGAVAAKRAAAAEVTITGYRMARTGHDLWLARLSAELGAPVILGGPDEITTRIDRASQMVVAGAQVAVVLRGDSAEDDAALAASAGLALAWEAEPGLGSLGRMAESLLQRFPGELRHIRLIGGGPEAAMQEGKGVGELMRCLALTGYQGTLVLAPSTTRYRVAWQTWLGRRGGRGRGSNTADPSLVSLAGPVSTGRTG
jgi:hypothetical protein